MKFLIFSDLHKFNKENLNKIKEDFDLIITLGDIYPSTLKEIILFFPEKQIFGILGNHDGIDMFTSVNKRLETEKHYNLYNGDGIININLKEFKINNICFTGIEGCNKYKTFIPGYTQKESLNLDIPFSNILFSHDTGYKYMTQDDLAHKGLKGISRYIKRKKPKYHIFGHYHKNTAFTIKKTKCFCVYGCSIFDYETGVMKNIF